MSTDNTVRQPVGKGEPSVLEALAQLKRIVAELVDRPTFSGATQLCRWTRRAWNVVYWQCLKMGDAASFENAREFLDLAREGLVAMDHVSTPEDPMDGSRLEDYKTCVLFRGDNAEVLVNEGADEVHRRLQNHLTKVTASAV